MADRRKKQERKENEGISASKGRLDNSKNICKMELCIPDC